MLRWALVFLAVALLAALVAMSGLAPNAVGLAKITFFAFAVLAAIAMVATRLRKERT